MVTRIERLSGFSTGAALDDIPLELLCEDHRGTYVLPYPCIRSGADWRNAATTERIKADVIGWRLHKVDAPGLGRNVRPVQRGDSDAV
jgi:hypothetical protein